MHVDAGYDVCAGEIILYINIITGNLLPINLWNQLLAALLRIVRLYLIIDTIRIAVFSREQINEILDIMFPITENDSDRKKANIQSIKDGYYICYAMPDLAQFKGTAWGAINAMADYVGHSAPKRNTVNFEENRWGKIMDGHAWMDEFAKLIDVKVGAGV